VRVGNRDTYEHAMVLFICYVELYSVRNRVLY
jgi:hypothetical protein